MPRAVSVLLPRQLLPAVHQAMTSWLRAACRYVFSDARTEMGAAADPQGAPAAGRGVASERVVTNAEILRAVQALAAELGTLTWKVDQLMSQSDEIAADVTAIEGDVARINAGVASALALITTLEAQAAAGQPVNPAVLASLKQAVADVGTAASGVAGIAPAAPPPPGA